MNKFLLILISIVFASQLQAQHSTRWKRYRYEVVMGVGATNFLGELGGANKEGTNFLKDFEFTMTRPALNLGLRYKILDKLSTKVGLTYGRLRGDDATTEEIHRQNRNLNFYADIYELSGQLEYSLIREKIGHRYNLRRVRGLKGLKLNTYIFAGIGGFWFSPYGEDSQTGEWVALQPLGTEGQGMVDSREKYSRIQLAIPFGIGIKYGIDREWSIGLEFGARKTFTDYLDDVSTTYYDNDALAATNPQAARLADPSLVKNGQTAPNQQRGDAKDYDSYMFLLVTFNYKLKTTRKGLPKFGMGRRRY